MKADIPTLHKPDILTLQRQRSQMPRRKHHLRCMMPGKTSAGPLLDETFRRLIVKRRNLVMASFLGIGLLLTGGLAWTAPRQPKQASGEDGAKEVILIAAVGDNTSVDQMAPDFEAKTGYKIKVTYAVSGAIKKKVIDGEPFDVAILFMPIADALATGNLIESSVSRLAGVPIAMVIKKGAPKPDVSTPEALKQTLLAANGITYPHGTPGAFAGILTDGMMTKLGILDQMVPKIKPGGVAGVAKGDLDFAFLFQPEARDPGIEIVPLPASVQPVAQMVGAISSHSKNPAGAKQLLDYLSTPAAKAVYISKGMRPAS
jgi:molybdate transport system substrate-binding protein